MKRRLLLLALFVPAIRLLAQTSDPTATPFDSLVTNSPFGARSTETGPAANGAQLELRGIFVDQGETFFSVYDTSTRVSRWVGLNERGEPFTVRRYDAAHDSVTVEYQGRELALELKQVKVVALPPAPAPSAAPGPGQASGPGPRPISGASGGPGPAVGTTASAGPAPSPEDAARLAAIAEEIGRRRALRQRMLPPPSSPVK